MNPVFVETSNYKRFIDKLTRVDNRGARESCIVVVDGKPGLGKTATMMRWVSQTGSIYLRAARDWDYIWFIKELLINLSVEDLPRGRSEKFGLIMERLGDLAMDAALEDRPFGIVIDECDMVAGKPEIMETIRKISDLHFLPTILVGMGTLRDSLRRYPQIESRAPNKCAFELLTLEDARALMSGLSTVPIADDLVQFCWRASGGYNRELVEAIAAIERFGQRIDPGPAGVTMADMAGQVIMGNRKTSGDIIVPEGL